MSAAVVESSEFMSPVVPERADQPVSVTAERFLRAIVQQVPLERIEELHLFSPLRQGSVETGIAVVAARRVVQQTEDVLSVASDETLPLELTMAGELGGLAPRNGETADGEDSGDSGDARLHGDEGDAADDAGQLGESGESKTNETEEGETSAAVAQADGDDEGEASVQGEGTAEASTAPVERHTVYTARYRQVIKGPERGRWETDIVEEADAPLVTVETVVRGVQRRAGEDSEIVRYNAAQIARALRMEWPAPVPSAGESGD